MLPTKKERKDLSMTTANKIDDVSSKTIGIKLNDTNIILIS